MMYLSGNLMLSLTIVWTMVIWIRIFFSGPYTIFELCIFFSHSILHAKEKKTHMLAIRKLVRVTQSVCAWEPAVLSERSLMNCWNLPYSCTRKILARPLSSIKGICSFHFYIILLSSWFPFSILLTIHSWAGITWYNHCRMLTSHRPPGWEIVVLEKWGFACTGCLWSLQGAEEDDSVDTSIYSTSVKIRIQISNDYRKSPTLL